MRHLTSSHALSAEESNDLRDMVLRHGERAVCEVTGIHPQTLARLVARLDVRAGTAALGRIGLKKARAAFRSRPASPVASAEADIPETTTAA